LLFSHNGLRIQSLLLTCSMLVSGSTQVLARSRTHKVRIVSFEFDIGVLWTDSMIPDNSSRWIQSMSIYTIRIGETCYEIM